jgi:hypothetical protein
MILFWGGENLISGKKRAKFFFVLSKAPGPEINAQKSEFIFMSPQKTASQITTQSH